MRLSRRDFVKVAALTAAALSLPAPKLLRRSSSAGLALQGDSGGDAGIKVARTACFICGQKCPLVVTVEERGGRQIVKSVKFNVAEGSEEEYAVCGRPQALFEARVMPQRVKKPLIRVGERGSGRFREITWEEALNVLASKLREYDPEEIVVFSHQGCEAGVFSYFFKNVVGTPNVTKHCDTCYTGIDYASWWLFGKMMGPGSYRPDYINAKLVVFMGRNPLEGIVSAPWTKLFSEGRRKGMRVIVFDVRESRLTDIADRYYIIPPGTDLAVSLALINVIINDRLYDEEYLRTYTNAPMLIYTDTMEPVRLEDNPFSDGKKTYAVIDESDGSVKLKTEAQRPALDAEVEVDGRRAVTALRLIKEYLKDYTPAWASGITGIPAEDIVWLAGQLASEAPRAFIDTGYKGTRYRNEGMMFRANLLVNALLGSIGRKGGVAWPRKVKLENPLSIIDIKAQGPRGEPLYKYWEERGVTFIHKKCFSMLAIKSILEEKPRKIRAAVVFNQNLVAHLQGSADVIEALKKLDFIVVIDSTFNETTLYADLILPVAMFFEASSCTLFSPSKTGRGQVTVIEKVLDPPEGVDARPGWWILKELGKRLDPANADKYESLADHESIWRVQAEALGIDFDGLVKNGVVTIYDEPLYHPLKGKAHATTTGEIELVSVEGLAKYRDHVGRRSHYNPLPTWIPPAWMDAGRGLADNEFVAVDVCHRMTATNMWIRFTRISNDALAWDGMDGVLVHPNRAERLGLRDGDRVLIKGPGGALEARVRVSSRVHPLVVLAPHATNAGPASAEVEVEYIDGSRETIRLFPDGAGAGINTNMLARHSDMVLEEGGRSMQCDVIVRLEKA